VLGRERQTNNGDGEDRSQEKMDQGQFQTRKDDSDNIHDDSQATTRRFGFTYLLTKWRQSQDGQFKTLDSKRDSDNGEA